MAASAESGTTPLERVGSFTFAKHIIAPLQRASSLLGSGELWQAHADADEAHEAAMAEAADLAARRPWKLNQVLGRIETSLSRFSWSSSKPPLSSATGPRSPTIATNSVPTVQDNLKPAGSPRVTRETSSGGSTWRAAPSSPTASSPSSRRFQQRGAAESQITFRLSPPPSIPASASADGACFAASTTTTSENDNHCVTLRIGDSEAEELPTIRRLTRGTNLRCRRRAPASMDEMQLSAWQDDDAAASPKDVNGISDGDLDGIADENGTETAASPACAKGERKVSFKSNGAGDGDGDGGSESVCSDSEAAFATVTAHRVAEQRTFSANTRRHCHASSGPLLPRRESYGGSSKDGSSRGGSSPSGSGRSVTGGSGRSGSSDRAMLVGEARASLTPPRGSPSSPVVRRFSFEAYRQQMTAQ